MNQYLLTDIEEKLAQARAYYNEEALGGPSPPRKWFREAERLSREVITKYL